MLFNSFEFLLLFLPGSLALFYLLGGFSREWALRWVILASLGFYAWWRPFNVFIIGPALVVTFSFAKALQHVRASERPGTSRLLLGLGVAFNVAFLGYFKYANFTVGVVNDVFGTDYFLARIVLPLGISFITFQKIAFLVDVQAGRVERFTFQDFCLFILFFPQLIAGPIVHFRDTMPQFRSTDCRPRAEHLTVGLTLFAFGLFKKVYLADSIAPMVSSLFEQAGTGNATFVTAWMAALGFTLQIYFDFSGYTDMALGAARLFGIRLPVNFDSPLRATNIIDFWLRWHVSLTRFLTAYLYNPLAIWRTRERMRRGQRSIGGRKMSAGAFFEVLAAPTLFTMLLSGLWHGAGYLFILWGGMHGVYLVVNHAWRQVGPRLFPDRDSYDRFMGPAGFVLTFLGVAASMVVFRAPEWDVARTLLAAMAGVPGPGGAAAMSGGLPKWVVLLLFVALVMPNTLQMLAPHGPALGIKEAKRDEHLLGRALTWRPSLAWAAVLAVAAALSVLNLGGQSEFLYWQF